MGTTLAKGSALAVAVGGEIANGPWCAVGGKVIDGPW